MQCHNANAPVFVRREVAQRDALRKATEMLKNTKYKVNIYMYSLAMSTNVKRRERKRERKQKSGEFNVKEGDGYMRY